MRYPADPPPVEEIIAVMRAAGAGAYGDRLRGVMVVCWRAGLRVGEALAPAETDLDPSQGAILILAVGFMVVNLAVDVLYAYLDPRIARS